MKDLMVVPNYTVDSIAYEANFDMFYVSELLRKKGYSPYKISVNTLNLRGKNKIKDLLTFFEQFVVLDRFLEVKDVPSIVSFREYARGIKKIKVNLSFNCVRSNVVSFLRWQADRINFKKKNVMIASNIIGSALVIRNLKHDLGSSFFSENNVVDKVKYLQMVKMLEDEISYYVNRASNSDLDDWVDYFAERLLNSEIKLDSHEELRKKKGIYKVPDFGVIRKVSVLRKDGVRQRYNKRLR